MKNFRSYQQAKKLYQQCQQIQLKPYELRNQLQRAVLSVVLNLSEGYGRRTDKDRNRFYSIALGSLREVQSILDITNQKQAGVQADIVGAHIYKLIASS